MPPLPSVVVGARARALSAGAAIALLCTVVLAPHAEAQQYPPDPPPPAAQPPGAPGDSIEPSLPGDLPPRPLGVVVREQATLLGLDPEAIDVDELVRARSALADRLGEFFNTVGPRTTPALSLNGTIGGDDEVFEFAPDSETLEILLCCVGPDSLARFDLRPRLLQTLAGGTDDDLHLGVALSDDNGAVGLSTARPEGLRPGRWDVVVTSVDEAGNPITITAALEVLDGASEGAREPLLLYLLIVAAVGGGAGWMARRRRRASEALVH